MQAQVTEWSHAMMTSLAAAMAMFFSAIPKIIGFAIIVIVGWLLSSLVEKGIAALLRAVKFNDLANRSGLGDFVAKMNAGTDSAGMIGLVVKWFIRLIALVVAFDALGLPAVSEVLRELLLWLPNVVVALVVLVIGGLAAKALSNVVRGAAGEAGLTNANFLSKVASAVVWAFAVVVAVNQLGIATTLVNTLFMAFVGAIALALGLSFGLGGRETAGEILRNWYTKGQQKSGQIARAAEAAGNQMGSGSRPVGATPYSGPERRGAAAGMTQGNAQLYPTPSSARHESEGG
ncbi:MAG TPA: small-conductance mechanosensitive ion channel [Ramlibacter sp.]|nr:small-conductance mechanosensitive ion channel [Ramlibacter sp.]